MTITSKTIKCLKNNLLLIITLGGVLIGFIIGIALRSNNFNDETIMLISYPGELFARILKLLILPLLISSIVNVSANLNARMNGKILLRTLIFFALTSMFTAFLGICIALMFKPGNISTSKVNVKLQNNQTNALDAILDLGRNLFPDNIFQATFQQTYTVYPTINVTNVTIKSGRVLHYRSGPNMIGIACFCIFFGTVISSIGERGEELKRFFAALFEVMLKLVTLVMWLSGIGAASIIAAKLLTFNDLDEIMSQLGLFLVCSIFGLFLHQLVVLPTIYILFVRENPYKFLIKLAEPWITGFAACSSSVTLPTTLRCMNVKMKGDSRITNFVLTLGVNLHTNGSALCLSLSAIFIAYLSGTPLLLKDLFIILIMSTTSSMSMPTVPGGSFIMLLVILSAINVDTESAYVLFAVDWILDRLRTTSNVIGDCFAAAVIEKLSRDDLKKLDSMLETNEKPENVKLLEVA